jgi:hypothetical protein
MIAQLIIDWLILSAASACTLVLLTYRDMAQAREHQHVLTGGKKAPTSPPIIIDSANDRVRTADFLLENKELSAPRERLEVAYPGRTDDRCFCHNGCFSTQGVLVEQSSQRSGHDIAYTPGHSGCRAPSW